MSSRSCNSTDRELSHFFMFITTHLLAALAVIAGLLAPLFAPSLTFATLPANELWREALVNNVVGFGKNTTGGKGGDLCEVTNLNDSGAGSLRACATATGTLWIVFRVSGTIALESAIAVRSNKTIDGRGQDITLTTAANFPPGYGMFEIGRLNFNNGQISNVIVENLKFKECNTNGMLFIGEQASNIWVDHNTFQDSVDEEMYIGSGGHASGFPPNNITVSWNHFPAASVIPGSQGPCTGGVPSPECPWAHKALLISDQAFSQDVGGHLTLHHNHFQVGARTPAAKWLRIHGFNNWHNQPKDSAVEISESGAQYYSENEVLEAPYSGFHPMIQAYQGGISRVVNPYLLNSATYQEVNPGSIFNPASFYSYTPDTANATLQSTLTAQAGWQNATAPSGPVASYAFDGVANDGSGNANNGSLVGSPTYTTGKVGQAISLNGTSQYVNVLDAPSLDLAGPYTLAAWVKPSQTLTNFASILVKNYTYYLYGGTSGYCGAGAPIGGTSGGQAACDPAVLPANTWTHVVVTYDGSTVRLYRNGVQSATAASNVNPVATTGTLQIGASQFGEYFLGAIDEVQVYNRALAATEIATLANPTPLAAPQNLRVLQGE